MTRYAPQWLQQASFAASVDRRLISALWPTPAVNGGAVTPATAMTLNIAAGQAAVPSQNNTGSTLCTWDATEQVTLTAAPASGSNRYDLVTVHPRGNDLDGGSNNDFLIDFVTGTAAASPTVPATPAGQLALAQVYVPGGSASVTAGNITPYAMGGLSLPSDSGWIAPTLLNGWLNVGAPFNNAAYRKTGTRVYVRGCLKSGTMGNAAFTLPAGFTPPGNCQFSSTSNNLFGILSVTAAGTVTPAVGSNVSFFIELSFDTV